MINNEKAVDMQTSGHNPFEYWDTKHTKMQS
jgi:hypothetical protein